MVKDQKKTIEKLKEQNEELEEEAKELKKNGGFLGDPETSECANALAWRLTRDKIKELERMKRWIDRPLKDIEKLKEECKENFDEAQKWMGLMYQYREKWGKLQKDNEELKEEVERLTVCEQKEIERAEKAEHELDYALKFISGNYDYEQEVKEIIKREFVPEFIQNNEERWTEVGLEFEEE